MGVWKVKALIGREIRITNCTDEFWGIIKNKLIFNNPKYDNAVRMGFSTYKLQKNINMFWKKGNELYIPYGMVGYVTCSSEMFDEIKYEFEDNKSYDYSCKVNLRDYQKKAIEKAFVRDCGVLVAPCGSGKTTMGLELIARHGKRALWITHTKDLLTQSMNRAKEMFGLPDSDYGTITDGTINIGRVITFATIQTLYNIDLLHYYDMWDVIVVDECHRICGSPTNVTMFYRALSCLKSPIKYGLTATPKRTDGLTQCMYSIIGDKIYEIKRDEVSTGIVPIVYNAVQTNYIPDINSVTNSDGTISYNSLISDITKNKERNNVIVELIKSLEGSTLVLTDRVEHINNLNAMCRKAGLKSTMLHSKSRKRELNAIYDGVENSNIVVIATYSIAKEGLDMPNLRNIVFATPNKTDNTITQAAGRVARAHEGKTIGNVYDVVDEWDVLQKWSAKRKNIISRLKY
jgi:superfamily II DNA or RNA helicase